LNHIDQTSEDFPNRPLQVCYLDFDGVLHDDAAYWSPERGMHMKTPGRILFEWMPILDALLAPHPDVKIVLSTLWVCARSFEFAYRYLSPTLKARVIGATFHIRHTRRDEFQLNSRGYQVWNDVVRRRPSSWFAIDNDDTGWPASCRDRLVKTEDALGLSDPRVQDAVRQMLVIL